MDTLEMVGRSLKAISDQTRLQIVQLLGKQALCACDLLEVFDITQPTLSYHMRILMESGVVIGKKEGVWMRYALSPEAIEMLIVFFAGITEKNTETATEDL